MKTIVAAGALILALANQARAQTADTTIVDYATRTVTVARSATSAGPAIVTGGADLSGTVFTQFAPANTAYLFFTLNNMSVRASISGFTDPTTLNAVDASVWAWGASDDTRLNGAGQENGYGNDFGQIGSSGPFNRPLFAYTPGMSSVPYNISALVFLNFTGQGPGASATGHASFQLLSVDARDANFALLATAAFDENGNATFGTVPEPSSLALLGTGLVSMVPIVRRKRRAA